MAIKDASQGDYAADEAHDATARSHAASRDRGVEDTGGTGTQRTGQTEGSEREDSGRITVGEEDLALNDLTVLDMVGNVLQSRAIIGYALVFMILEYVAFIVVYGEPAAAIGLAFTLGGPCLAAGLTKRLFSVIRPDKKNVGTVLALAAGTVFLVGMMLVLRGIPFPSRA
ncbi:MULTISPECIES: hypothetical protein [unclassified Actinobaculum]|uniref:hypothetical protein n=1 Tax=unclassified Actinobaculum TaxID=2609299 RepID=UPI000D527302|nr:MULTISPECIES: hypothetical protein [unclassified Actinobaculum]AWE43325.1 hypothetical protein DDD63_11850 [Actinobaculum sp. 313]RTE49775.1 hypothetical protein EKN07_04430 [Actinobaculum sp. 352]